MSISKILYPDLDNSDSTYFYGPCDYNPIVKHFGKVILQWDQKSYQGDTGAILKKGNQFGYLNFGWGSCSGCDALQACNNFADIDKLIEHLETQIQWFDSLQDLKDYFAKTDWEAKYCWGEPEFREFVKNVQKLEDK